MERNEETDRSNEDTGTGRFYECVFCKRGFTTAQALGGHMNIHRKHRAKRKPNSPKFDADYYATTLRGYPPIQTYPINNYQSFVPPAAASGWGFRPPNSDGFYGQNQQIMEEDWRRNLNLQIGPSSEHKKEDGGEAGELDLELRLGH